MNKKLIMPLVAAIMVAVSWAGATAQEVPPIPCDDPVDPEDPQNPCQGEADEADAAARAAAREALLSTPVIVWTNMNMGDDSGLDADLLDGQHADDLLAEALAEALAAGDARYLTPSQGDSRYVRHGGSANMYYLALNYLRASGYLMSEQDMYVGYGSSSDDDRIYFDRGSKRLEWDEHPGNFYFNEDLTIAGHFRAGGNKYFVQAHPTDETKMVQYAAIEGPESAIFWRGSAQLSGGAATVSFPEEFRLVLSESVPITVQATLTSDAAGIFVTEKTLDGFTVKEIGGGTSDATFDFFVQAGRAGYEDMPVIVDNDIGLEVVEDPYSPDALEVTDE